MLYEFGSAVVAEVEVSSQLRLSFAMKLDSMMMMSSSSSSPLFLLPHLAEAATVLVHL